MPAAIKRLFAPIDNVPNQLKASYYPALDGLRAIAILMVLFHHFGADHWLRGTGVFIDSRAGVQIFFVLSGFLITTLLVKEQLQYQNISVRYFYIRRALRILPVAYLFLLVLVLLNYECQLNIRPIDFVASLLFLNNFPVGPEQPFTAHLWTLAVEEQFYLLLPALLSMGVNRYFNLALAVVILVPLVSIGSNLHTAPETGSLMVVGKACRYVFWKGPIMILVGSVFSLLTFKSAINSRTHFLLSFFLLLAAIAICSRTFVFYEKYVCEFVAALLIGYAIVLISSNRDLLALCLAHPVLRWVGRLSYSIYIWQEVFIGLRTWQPWLGWMSGWPLWTVVLAKLAAAFIIAVSSYYLFESKFLRVKRRFSRTKPLVSSGAPASVPLKPQQPA